MIDSGEGRDFVRVKHERNEFAMTPEASPVEVEGFREDSLVLLDVLKEYVLKIGLFSVFHDNLRCNIRNDISHDFSS